MDVSGGLRGLNRISHTKHTEFLRAAGLKELPAWNRDGLYPMPVLTEEILAFICFGRVNPRTGSISGGHIQGALDRGGGKRWHKEFPPAWTPETVREAYYQVIQIKPVITKSGMVFTGAYRGVKIVIECSFDTAIREEMRVHLYPVAGSGVRAWKNGKPFKVSQKRQK